MLALRQIDVTRGAQLPSTCRKTKFMITGTVGNMAVGANFLAIDDIVEAATALVIGVTRGAGTRLAIDDCRVT